jgi:glutathione S-transferase
MKLYSVELSPFAARVRMAIYAKSLDIAILNPPGGTKSPEYLAINPIGKIPSLELDDGTVIVESETIVEYLEDKFPTPSLRGTTPEATAKARMVARVAELYAVPHLQALFGQMSPKTRDQARTDEALDKLTQGLGHLNALLPSQGFAAGPELTTADCLIAPMLFFMPMIGGAFAHLELLNETPKLSAYIDRMQAEPVYQRVQAEMERGLQAMRAAG